MFYSWHPTCRVPSRLGHSEADVRSAQAQRTSHCSSSSRQSGLQVPTSATPPQLAALSPPMVRPDSRAAPQSVTVLRTPHCVPLTMRANPHSAWLAAAFLVQSHCVSQATSWLLDPLACFLISCKFLSSTTPSLASALYLACYQPQRRRRRRWWTRRDTWTRALRAAAAAWSWPPQPPPSSPAA